VIAVPVLPGVNCEHDTVWALQELGGAGVLVHHRAEALPSGTQGVWIPGGFAYGDYLRAGAIARFAPVMQAISAAAGEGMPVLGVCNGFQVLCEAGLLEGALTRNQGLRFLCQDVFLRVETTASALTCCTEAGDVLRVPVNHGEGRFVAEKATLDELEAHGQVLLRYCSPDGEVDAEKEAWNPNGSDRAIAGVSNRAGNVVGLMPHPERAVEEILGAQDGRPLVRSLLEAASVFVGAALLLPAAQSEGSSLHD